MRERREPISAYAIEAKGIEKTYPKTGKAPAIRALKGVDLKVKQGHIFCILGPNGAGKTTLISILSGLLYPDAGSASVGGLNVLKERRKIRRLINLASGNASLPDNFTPDEMLTYFGMLYGLKSSLRREKTKELLRFFELQDYQNTPFNQLSTGLKQRLVLAKSLINDPKILFLDEPTLGLDPKASLQIRSRLKEWKTDTRATIILTTHQMDEAEQMSDEIAFLKDGRFVRIGRAEELKKGIEFCRQITIKGENFLAAKKPLSRLPGVSRIRCNSNEISFSLSEEEKGLDLILRTLFENGAFVEHIHISEPTLGDVFIELADQPDPS